MKKSKYKNWSDEQLSFLLENYSKIPVDKIAQRIDKSIGSIYYILNKENIDLEIQWWTAKEIKLLKKLYSEHSNQKLEELFARSDEAIQMKAASLGLKKSSWWSEEDVELLKEMVFDKLSYTKMAKVLERTRSAVHNKLIAEKLTDECRQWTDEELEKIKEMAISGQNTYLDIAMTLNATPSQVAQSCKYYGWRDNIKRTMSYGNDKMIKLLKKMFPHYLIKQEYHIGEKLRLDAYIKELNIGCEYDGQQHFKFVPLWHHSKADFRRAQERDERKNILCVRQGITLVRIKYDEDLTEKLLWDKLEIQTTEAIIDSEPAKKIIPAKPKTKIQSKGFEKSERKTKWPTRKIQSRKFNPK